MSQNDFYYSEKPWSIIKSYILTFDKTRSTKTAKIMKPICEYFDDLLYDDRIFVNEIDFPFIYFFVMMPYRKKFNYAILTR